MSQFTSEWFSNYNARQLANQVMSEGDGEMRAMAQREVGKGGLQEQILKECRRMDWPVIHARTDKPSTIGVGVHDLTIYTPHHGILNIECKAANRKRTVEQLRWAAHLKRKGYEVIVVTSFEQFLEVVRM